MRKAISRLIQWFWGIRRAVAFITLLLLSLFWAWTPPNRKIEPKDVAAFIAFIILLTYMSVSYEEKERKKLKEAVACKEKPEYNYHMRTMVEPKIYSSKIQKAIGFAVQVHEIDQKQKRKGKDIPYITHPLTVGLILAQAASEEEVVIAGILHDTIEDSVAEKKVSRDMLAERFGDPIADMVQSVSEKRKELPWQDRKRDALAHIATYSHNELLVKSADILSNATELLNDYRQGGEAIFNRFNAPKEKILGHYFKAVAAILERWPESPLARDLKVVAEELRTI